MSQETEFSTSNILGIDNIDIVFNINNDNYIYNDYDNFIYGEEHYSKRRNCYVFCDYDINIVHQEHNSFAVKNFMNLQEALIAKEYIEMIVKYNIFNTIDDCKNACSIFKSLYPKIAKRVCDVILQTNQETKNMSLLKRRRIYKDSQIINVTKTIGNNGCKIYQIFKEQKPLCYKIFIDKKFSTTLNNIIVTLNKISYYDLIYIKKQLYCFNDYKWSSDKNDLAVKIKNILLTHFNTEALRVNYQPNLSKLHNTKFIQRIIAHYARYKYHHPAKSNIKLNNDNKEYIFFKNYIFGMPRIHTQKCLYYKPGYYNTMTTGYAFEEPKNESIENIKKLLCSMVPDKSIRNTLVNICCSSLLRYNIGLLVVLHGNKSGINVILNMMLAMLGDYGISLSSSLLLGENNIKSQVKDKRFVAFKDYKGEFIDNDQLVRTLNTNNYSTYFLEATEEPRFKNVLSYNLSRKIVEIKIAEDVDNISIDSLNNYDAIKSHRCALFKCLLEYFQNKYHHHTCNAVWYCDNVDRESKLCVTKYKEYNKIYNKFFGI